MKIPLGGFGRNFYVLTRQIDRISCQLWTSTHASWGPVRLASTRSKRIACLCTSEIQTRLCLPKPTGKLFQATKITEAKSCLTFAGQLKSNYPILKSLTVVRPMRALARFARRAWTDLSLRFASFHDIIGHAPFE